MKIILEQAEEAFELLMKRLDMEAEEKRILLHKPASPYTVYRDNLITEGHSNSWVAKHKQHVAFGYTAEDALRNLQEVCE